ncbi:hypothetical protein JCM10450v2_002052 [Rhodotorula kratochvilovae]
MVSAAGESLPPTSGRFVTVDPVEALFPPLAPVELAAVCQRQWLDGWSGFDGPFAEERFLSVRDVLWLTCEGDEHFALRALLFEVALNVPPDDWDAAAFVDATHWSRMLVRARLGHQATPNTAEEEESRAESVGVASVCIAVAAARALQDSLHGGTPSADLERLVAHLPRVMPALGALMECNVVGLNTRTAPPPPDSLEPGCLPALLQEIKDSPADNHFLAGVLVKLATSCGLHPYLSTPPR